MEVAVSNFPQFEFEDYELRFADKSEDNRHWNARASTKGAKKSGKTQTGNGSKKLSGIFLTKKSWLFRSFSYVISYNG